MAARKPKLELYWTDAAEPEVNWRLVAANGEVLCQCTQGFRDKADAMRNVHAVAVALDGGQDRPLGTTVFRIVGPGRKPT